MNNNISKWILFFIGFFSTMPIVTINLMNKSISFYNIAMYMYIVYKGILFLKMNKFTFKLNYHSKVTLLWLVMVFVSCVFGCVYFIDDSIWLNAITGYIPKVISYILFLVCVLDDKLVLSWLINGIFSGAIVNLIVCSLDAIYYYSFGNSFVNEVFSKYSQINNIRYGMISLIKNGTIRSGGLNYDPAHIGMLAPMIFLYGLISKKIYLVILSLLALIGSMSTTAAVSILVLFILNYKYIDFKFKKKLKKEKIIFVFIIFIITVGLIFQERDKISVLISEGTSNFADRITNVYLQSDLEDDVRFQYVESFPDAVATNGLKVLTGTGLGTASYGYVYNDLARENIPKLRYSTPSPYDMENTYIAYFFDLGIFGVVIYIYLLIQLLVKLRRLLTIKNEYIIAYAGISSIIISNIFYHYILFSIQILILIYAALVEKEKKKI